MTARAIYWCKVHGEGATPEGCPRGGLVCFRGKAMIHWPEAQAAYQLTGSWDTITQTAHARRYQED